MLTFIFFLSSLFAQTCTSLPGGRVCSAGIPCITDGQQGQCANLAAPGGQISCGCAVPQQVIPLDENWIALFGSSAVWATSPSTNYEAQITALGYANSADDSLFNSSVALTIPIDTSTQGYAGYVWRPVQGVSLSGASHLTATLQIAASSGAVVAWDTPGNDECKEPATIRPFLSNPPGGGVPNWMVWATDGTGRWWSDTAFVVASDDAGNVIPQTATVTVSLDPSQWSGVYGQSAVGDPYFAQVIASPADVGFTLGGGCFYGHGWRTVTGSVTVSVLALSYQ